MSLYADRVKESSTTTGTGTLNLGGAPIRFRTFVAGIGTGKQACYTIEHATADEWEVGVGTVTDATPDTLSRTTVIASSNGGSLVNFSAGDKTVFCTVPARMADLYAVLGPQASPASPAAENDEFTWTSLPAAYTVVNTPGGSNVSLYGHQGSFLAIKGPGGGSNDALSIRRTITRSGAFSATFRSEMIGNEQYQGIFISFGDSANLLDGSTGKLIRFGHEFRGSAGVFCDSRDGGSWSYALGSETDSARFRRAIYMHIQRDGSNNWQAWWSTEGASWRRFLNTSFTLTISHVAYLVTFGGHNPGHTIIPASLDFVRYDWLTL